MQEQFYDLVLHESRTADVPRAEAGELLAQQVRRCARAAVREIVFAGARADRSDQLGERAGGNRRVDRDHMRARDGERDD